MMNARGLLKHHKRRFSSDAGALAGLMRKSSASFTRRYALSEGRANQEPIVQGERRRRCNAQKGRTAHIMASQMSLDSAQQDTTAQRALQALMMSRHCANQGITAQEMELLPHPVVREKCWAAWVARRKRSALHVQLDIIATREALHLHLVPVQQAFFMTKYVTHSHLCNKRVSERVLPSILKFILFSFKLALPSRVTFLVAGKYCPAGTESLSRATECDAGHMCPEGSAAPVPCPRGTKQPETGKASCISCSAGEICSEGSTAGQTCQVGFTCPEGTSVNTSFPCPPGTFSDQPGSCTSCPKGFYCDEPARTAASGQCKAGYYCPAGTKWKEPTTICKHGEMCPPGSSTPQDCPPNHFCNTPKLGEPSGPCSGGFVCTSRSTSPRPTGEQNGSSCDENMQGRPCLKGHYCPRPDSPLIAGTGFAGSSGDGLSGPETLLKLPANAIMDPTTGDVYVTDYSNYAVKVVHGDIGTVETLVSGASVGGALSWIQSTSPVGLAFCQRTKKLYISYPGRNAIVEHDVGLRSSALLSELSAKLSKPLGLDIDADCTSIYIADSGSHRVLKHELAASQSIETIIGTGTAGKSDPAAPTAPTSFQINLPSGVALHNGILYVVDSGNRRVLEVTLGTNAVKVLPGAGDNAPSSGQSPLGVFFEKPVSAAIAEQESDILLVVADVVARALRKIDLTANTISTLKDFSAWRSPVVDDAETSIATAGLEEAFYGISSFYGANKKRTGVLLADSYTHRIRRIDLEGDLYSRPALSDIPCPKGTYLPYTGAASEAECIKCPFGMYCSTAGLIEPEGRIGARARRPNTRELPLQHEALPGSNLTGSRATPSSGWFTRRPGTACCSGVGMCPHRAVANQDKEEIFVVDLEKPTDLLGILVQLEGDQYPATDPFGLLPTLELGGAVSPMATDQYTASWIITAGN
ncbi:hypothetical protein EMWEY_00000230 [Eimeria maxima]|uniref:Cytadherence high molecular weight protein 2, related n=1 Tax=Eimeria maxima TaxID=5804 RepID=U6LW00_EIMMA|nr:hypothetical protein EMWEY_00000230 [Eimeria maxima]CDJ55941.1 hypothetical protein EMWEY_00000230 [Eimeria maxima]